MAPGKQRHSSHCFDVKATSLVFADDIVLLAKSVLQGVSMLKDLEANLAPLGLLVNLRETLIWFASAPGPGARVQTGCPKYGPPARADTQFPCLGGRKRPASTAPNVVRQRASWSKNTLCGSRLTDQEFWGTIFGVCREP